MVLLRARRAHAVNSYEGEGAVVLFFVRADEFASHEPGVRVERVMGGFVGRRVSARSLERAIELTYDAVEVGHRRGIAPLRMIPRGR